jgi:hypothetical protein
MVDRDGQDLAKSFYKLPVLLAKRPVCRTMSDLQEALRDAIQKLRRKRGITLERWVNYVHYGA